MLLATKTQ
jgi:predicted mannosyl-3-phosphoglycerate phosphatase (HAD superfamily)